MLNLVISQNGDGVDFVLTHPWVLLFLVFIIVLVFVVVGLVISWVILRKVRAEVAKLAVALATRLVSVLVFSVSSSPVVPEDESSRILALGSDINIHNAIQVCEDVVQEVEVTT